MMFGNGDGVEIQPVGKRRLREHIAINAIATVILVGVIRRQLDTELH